MPNPARESLHFVIVGLCWLDPENSKTRYAQKLFPINNSLWTFAINYSTSPCDRSSRPRDSAMSAVYNAPCCPVFRYVPSVPCHLKVCRVYKRELSMRFSIKLYTKSSQTCRGYVPSSHSPLCLAHAPRDMPVPKRALLGAHVRPRSKHKLPSLSSVATLPCHWTTQTQDQTRLLMSRCSKCPLTRHRRREVLYSTLVGRVSKRGLVWRKGLSYCRREIKIQVTGFGVWWVADRR